MSNITTLGRKKRNYGDVLAHCKRELFHGVWRILLDDNFIEAYKNGIVIKCYDGVVRRVFPRIFTYSADYPEK
jgi:Plavaka transposase